MDEQKAKVILVVDDNSASRYAVARILRHAGFETDEAGSGAEALEAVKNSPDLILLDINMPDINGFEVCKQIRSDPSVAHTPILMLSATYRDAESTISGLASGADGYLTHPVEPPVLLAYVNALLRTRQAEQDALSVAQQWQVSSNALSTGICVTDPNGRVLRCNQALSAILDRPMDKINGHACEEVSGLLLPAFTDAPLLHDEIELSHDERWFRITSDPVFDATDQLRELVHTLTDITERKQMEQQSIELVIQRERVNLLRGFIDDVSHEIRTPLAIINTNLGILKRGLEPASKDMKRLDQSKGQIHYMVDLVDSMLVMSKLDGDSPLNLVSLDLNQLLQTVITVSSSLIQNKRLTLVQNLADDVPPFFGDEDELQRAMMHIVENAVQYTPEGGSITIESSVQNQQIVVEIRDSGIGIGNDDLPHIFDRFYRVDHARTTRGIGLGLSITKAIIEAHHGSIQVESEFGKGSTFRVLLPVS